MQFCLNWNIEEASSINKPKIFVCDKILFNPKKYIRKKAAAFINKLLTMNGCNIKTLKFNKGINEKFLGH